MKLSEKSVAVTNEPLPIPQAIKQKIDYEFEAHIEESRMATKAMEPLLRYDMISASIMVGFVLSYADARRPSIAVLYRGYCCSVDAYNRAESHGTPVPTLSKYLFRRSIDCMDPAFVLAARYGSFAARKFFLGRQYRDYWRAAKARATKISSKAI